MRKRVSATKPAHRTAADSTDKQTELQTKFLPFLSAVTAECYVLDVNPKSCIPLYLVRYDSRNAIERLKAILTGSIKAQDLLLSGMFSGSPTSIVVPLVGDLATYLDDYLSDHYDSADDAAAAKATFPRWYGVIDGCQIRQALHELMDEIPETWGSFSWKVIAVHPNSSKDQYTQLARVQNERMKKGYSYDCTIYDLIRGLRNEYDKLIKEVAKTCPTGERGARSKVKHKDVAEKYDGGDHSTNTSIKQAVTVASRISLDSIRALGTVVNTTCADVIVENSDLNVYSLKSQAEVLANQDCRLFKNFVCFGSLRSAKEFMSADKDGQAEAQTNCIYRMKHWSELHKYRPVQARVISEQFDLAKQALKEQKKFLKFIKLDAWPPQLETSRDNMLRTTLYDTEIKTNRGNDTDVLPSLWKFFKQLYPARARGLEQAASSGTDSNGSAGTGEGSGHNPESEPTPTPPQDSDEPEDPADSREREEARRKAEEAEREQSRISALQINADSIMADVGISCINTCCQDFLKQVWNNNHTRADLVLSSIPHDSDKEILQSIPEFCSLVLHPGSYAFIIVSENHFSDLFQSFKEKSFKVSPHSFKILYDQSSIQRRTTIDFPQKHGDIALISKTEGFHPRNYKPSFEDFGARFKSLTGIKACQDRLKKPTEQAPLVPGEKSTDLYAHIIKMFSPTDGIIMDPLANGLTSALACLKTGRRSVCIDPSTVSFHYALGRLRVHVVPDVTMESHSDYSTIVNTTTEEDISDNEEATNIARIRRSSTDDVTPERSTRPQKRRRCQQENSGISSQQDSPVHADDSSLDTDSASNEPAAVEALLTLSA